MKYLWFAAGVLAAAAAAACSAVLEQRRRASRARRELLGAIARGIGAHAPVFDGLYEGLYQAAQEETSFFTDAYQEWCQRAAHLEDQDFRLAFAQAFSPEDTEDEALCRSKYRQLLHCIGAAGIVRLHESGSTQTGESGLQDAYYLVGGTDGETRPETGVLYTVLASAWVKDGAVVEHGTLIKAAEQEREDSHG